MVKRSRTQQSESDQPELKRLKTEHPSNPQTPARTLFPDPQTINPQDTPPNPQVPTNQNLIQIPPVQSPQRPAVLPKKVPFVFDDSPNKKPKFNSHNSGNKFGKNKHFLKRGSPQHHKHIGIYPPAPHVQRVAETNTKQLQIRANEIKQIQANQETPRLFKQSPGVRPLLKQTVVQPVQPMVQKHPLQPLPVTSKAVAQPPAQRPAVQPNVPIPVQSRGDLKSALQVAEKISLSREPRPTNSKDPQNTEKSKEPTPNPDQPKVQNQEKELVLQDQVQKASELEPLNEMPKEPQDPVVLPPQEAKVPDSLPKETKPPPQAEGVEEVPKKDEDASTNLLGPADIVTPQHQACPASPPTTPSPPREQIESISTSSPEKPESRPLLVETKDPGSPPKLPSQEKVSTPAELPSQEKAKPVASSLPQEHTKPVEIPPQPPNEPEAVLQDQVQRIETVEQPKPQAPNLVRPAPQVKPIETKLGIKPLQKPTLSLKPLFSLPKPPQQNKIPIAKPTFTGSGHSPVPSGVPHPNATGSTGHPPPVPVPHPHVPHPNIPHVSNGNSPVPPGVPHPNGSGLPVGPTKREILPRPIAPVASKSFEPQHHRVAGDVHVGQLKKNPPIINPPKPVGSLPLHPKVETKPVISVPLPTKQEVAKPVVEPQHQGALAIPESLLLVDDDDFDFEEMDFSSTPQRGHGDPPPPISRLTEKQKKDKMEIESPRIQVDEECDIDFQEFEENQDSDEWFGEGQQYEGCGREE